MHQNIVHMTVYFDIAILLNGICNLTESRVLKANMLDSMLSIAIAIQLATGN